MTGGGWSPTGAFGGSNYSTGGSSTSKPSSSPSPSPTPSPSKSSSGSTSSSTPRATGGGTASTPPVATNPIVGYEEVRSEGGAVSTIVPIYQQDVIAKQQASNYELQGTNLIYKPTGKVIAEGVSSYGSTVQGTLKDISIKRGDQIITVNPNDLSQVREIQNKETYVNLVEGSGISKITGKELDLTKSQDVKQIEQLGLNIIVKPSLAVPSPIQKPSVGTATDKVKNPIPAFYQQSPELEELFNKKVYGDTTTKTTNTTITDTAQKNTFVLKTDSGKEATVTIGYDPKKIQGTAFSREGNPNATVQIDGKYYGGIFYQTSTDKGTDYTLTVLPTIPPLYQVKEVKDGVITLKPQTSVSAIVNTYQNADKILQERKIWKGTVLVESMINEQNKRAQEEADSFGLGLSSTVRKGFTDNIYFLKEQYWNENPYTQNEVIRGAFKGAAAVINIPQTVAGLVDIGAQTVKVVPTQAEEAIKAPSESLERFNERTYYGIEQIAKPESIANIAASTFLFGSLAQMGTAKATELGFIRPSATAKTQVMVGETTKEGTTISDVLQTIKSGNTRATAISKMYSKNLRRSLDSSVSESIGTAESIAVSRGVLITREGGKVSASELMSKNIGFKPTIQEGKPITENLLFQEEPIAPTKYLPSGGVTRIGSGKATTSLEIELGSHKAVKAVKTFQPEDIGIRSATMAKKIDTASILPEGRLIADVFKSETQIARPGGGKAFLSEDIVVYSKAKAYPEIKADLSTGGNTLGGGIEKGGSSVQVQNIKMDFTKTPQAGAELALKSLERTLSIGKQAGQISGGASQIMKTKEATIQIQKQAPLSTTSQKNIQIPKMELSSKASSDTILKSSSPQTQRAIQQTRIISANKGITDLMETQTQSLKSKDIILPKTKPFEIQETKSITETRTEITPETRTEITPKPDEIQFQRSITEQIQTTPYKQIQITIPGRKTPSPPSPELKIPPIIFGVPKGGRQSAPGIGRSFNFGGLRGQSRIFRKGALSDLLSVGKSQLLFGKATSPRGKKYIREAMFRRIPTVELLRYKNKRKGGRMK